MEHAPEWTQHALRQLAARARRLVLHGLPLELFDLESEAVAAFRYLQSGSNSGKVVLRVAFLEQSAHGSHIVTGGSGGLALVTAGWLVGRGASAVVLSSRSGRVGAAQADTSAGSVASCALLAARCDASEPADRSMSPVEFHYQRGHQIGYVPLIAGTSYIALAREVMATYRAAPFRISDSKFHTFFFLDDETKADALQQISYHAETGNILIESNVDGAATVHAELRASFFEPAAIDALDTASAIRRCSRQVDAAEFYASIGNNYQGEFRTMTSSWVGENEVIAQIAFPNHKTAAFLRGCAWLDACNQPGVLLTQKDPSASQCLPDHMIGRPYFAARIASYEVLSTNLKQTRVMWGYHYAPEGEPALMRAYNASGKCVVQIHGGEMGELAPGFLESRRAQRHIYE
ncbi:hypothetical protein EMIHUDRAFT_123144, partial [Emiliania huxleyi CCMP1516]|uniref:PKS/mFAS DH domain-containing protein n=2 Tax=Emiliania huxleyi TaxID=2903 RepID=A0A0D3K3P2_EMIH1